MGRAAFAARASRSVYLPAYGQVVARVAPICRVLLCLSALVAAAGQNCTILPSGVQDAIVAAPLLVGTTVLGGTVIFPTKSARSALVSIVAVHVPSASTSVTQMDIGDTTASFILCGFGCQSVYVMFERFLGSTATCSPGLPSQAMFARFDTRGLPLSAPTMDLRGALPYSYASYGSVRGSRVGPLTSDSPVYVFLPRPPSGSAAPSINVVRLAAPGANASLVTSLGLLQLAPNVTAVAVQPLDPHALAAVVVYANSTGSFLLQAYDVSELQRTGNLTNGSLPVAASLPLDSAAAALVDCEASSNGTLAIALSYASGGTQIFIVAGSWSQFGVASLSLIGSFTLGETAAVVRLLAISLDMRFSSDGAVVAFAGVKATCVSTSCVPQLAMARLPLLPDGSIIAVNGTINATQSMIAVYSYAAGCDAVAPLLAPLSQPGAATDGAAVLVYRAGSHVPPLFDIYRLPLNATAAAASRVTSIAVDPPSMSWYANLVVQDAPQPAYAFAALSSGFVAQLSLGPKLTLLRSRLVESRRWVNMTGDQGGLRVGVLPGAVFAFEFRSPNFFVIQTFSDTDLTPLTATMLSGISEPAASPMYDPVTGGVFWTSRYGATVSIGGGSTCVVYRTYRVLVTRTNATGAGGAPLYAFTQLPRIVNMQMSLCGPANSQDDVPPALSRDGNGDPVVLYATLNATQSTMAVQVVLGPNEGMQPLNFSTADVGYMSIIRGLVGQPDGRAFYVAGSPASPTTTLIIRRIDTLTWTSRAASAALVLTNSPEFDGAALFSGPDVAEPTLLISFNNGRTPVWVNVSSGAIITFTKGSQPIDQTSRGVVDPVTRLVVSGAADVEPTFMFSTAVTIPAILVASPTPSPSISSSPSASSSASASVTGSTSASVSITPSSSASPSVSPAVSATATTSALPSASASVSCSPTTSASPGSGGSGPSGGGGGGASDAPIAISPTPAESAAAAADSEVVVIAAAGGGGGIALLALFVATYCMLAWRRRYNDARQLASAHFRSEARRSLARVSVTERALLLTQPLPAPLEAHTRSTAAIASAAGGAVPASLLSASALYDVLSMTMPATMRSASASARSAGNTAVRVTIAGAGSGAGSTAAASSKEQAVTCLQQLADGAGPTAAQLVHAATFVASAALDPAATVIAVSSDGTSPVKRLSRPLFDDAELQDAHREAAVALSDSAPPSVRRSAIEAGLRAFQTAMEQHRRASVAAGASGYAAGDATAANGPSESRSAIDSALDAAAVAVHDAISTALSADDLASLVASAGDACAAFSHLWDEKSLEAEANMPDEAAAPLASQLDAIAAVVGDDDEVKPDHGGGYASRSVAAAAGGTAAHPRRHQSAKNVPPGQRVDRVRIGLTALKASVDERLHSRQAARKAVEFARSGAAASQLAHLSAASASRRARQIHLHAAIGSAVSDDAAHEVDFDDAAGSKDATQAHAIAAVVGTSEEVMPSSALVLPAARGAGGARLAVQRAHAPGATAASIAAASGSGIAAARRQAHVSAPATVVPSTARPIDARSGADGNADKARCVMRAIAITAVSALASRVVLEMQQVIQPEDQAAAALLGATSAAFASVPSGTPVETVAARLGLPRSVARDMLHVVSAAEPALPVSAEASASPSAAAAEASGKALAGFSLLLCAATASADAAAAQRARAVAGRMRCACGSSSSESGRRLLAGSRSQLGNGSHRDATASAAAAGAGADDGAVPFTSNPLHPSRSRAGQRSGDCQAGMPAWATALPVLSAQLAAQMSVLHAIGGEEDASTAMGVGAGFGSARSREKRASFDSLAWKPVVPRSLKAAAAAAARQAYTRPAAAAATDTASTVAAGGRRRAGRVVGVVVPGPSLAGGAEQEQKSGHGHARRHATRPSAAPIGGGGGLQLTPLRSRSGSTRRQAHPASPTEAR